MPRSGTIPDNTDNQDQAAADATTDDQASTEGEAPATFIDLLFMLQFISILMPGVTSMLTSAIKSALQPLIGLKTQITYDEKGRPKLQVMFGGDIELILNGNVTIIQNGDKIHLQSGKSAIVSDGNAIVPFPLSVEYFAQLIMLILESLGIMETLSGLKDVAGMLSDATSIDGSNILSLAALIIGGPIIGLNLAIINTALAKIPTIGSFEESITDVFGL